MSRSGKVSPFFLNQAIETYSKKPSTPISLRHLINFGKQGRGSSLEKEGEKLLRGGNFLRNEIPVRLSHRLRDMQSLPYIVASHPRMVRVYNLYLDAFDRLRKIPPLVDLKDNDSYCEFMQSMLDDHAVIIPELAIGIAESSPALFAPALLDTFMTRMLRSRISRRVITEQHIALTSQFRDRQQRLGLEGPAPIEEERQVGIVDTRVNAAQVARRCVDLIKLRGGPQAQVPVLLEGELDEVFAYIPEHIEFMIYEIVRNAIHATVEHHGEEKAKASPVTLTFVHGAKDLVVRVTDQAGGLLPWGGLPPTAEFDRLLPNVLPPLTAQRVDIFSFSHMRRLHLHQTSLATPSTSLPQGVSALTTIKSLEGTVSEQLASTTRRIQSTLSPLTSPSYNSNSDLSQMNMESVEAQMKSGIGLPMAKMYADYLGGGLEIDTVLGHGSDAFIRIAKLGLAV